MTNEKNKYLTIFESIYDPIILVDKENNVENINHKAAEVFLNVAVPGTKYYSKTNVNRQLKFLNEELNQFIHSEKAEGYGIIELTKNNKLSTNDIIKIADQKMYQNKLSKKQQKNNDNFRFET